MGLRCPIFGEDARKAGSAAFLGATAILSGCATARMHEVPELNQAALACGLTYGELIQDAEAKKLLILFHVAPTAAQRHCVYQWARRNHLHLAVIDSIQFPPESH